VNEQEHQRLRVNLGAYVLDQLPAEEAAELERHLDGCARCTAELNELTPVASALGELRSRPQTVELADPPPELGERVVAAVDHQARREGRRAWSRAASIGAVAAAALVVGVLGTRALTDQDPAAPTVPLEAVQVVVDDPEVRATADLVDHTWGVEVKLHASGFDRGGRYRATIIGLDGRRYPAGGFVGTGAKEMDCNLNSSVLRARAAGFEVRDRAGSVVVSSSFG
jgi:hypothetical protein